jgi:hypothetical protein
LPSYFLLLYYRWIFHIAKLATKKCVTDYYYVCGPVGDKEEQEGEGIKNVEKNFHAKLTNLRTRKKRERHFNWQVQDFCCKKTFLALFFLHSTQTNAG